MERAEKGAASADVCVTKNPLADVVRGFLGLEAPKLMKNGTRI